MSTSIPALRINVFLYPSDLFYSPVLLKQKMRRQEDAICNCHLRLPNITEHKDTNFIPLFGKKKAIQITMNFDLWYTPRILIFLFLNTCPVSWVTPDRFSSPFLVTMFFLHQVFYMSFLKNTVTLFIDHRLQC